MFRLRVIVGSRLRVIVGSRDQDVLWEMLGTFSKHASLVFRWLPPDMNLQRTGIVMRP
jgi:hypothetical protein